MSGRSVISCLTLLLMALNVSGCGLASSEIDTYSDECSIIDNKNVDEYRNNEGQIVRFRALFTPLSDHEKQCLYNMKKLVDLQAEECGFSSNDVRGLRSLNELEKLDLDGNAIGDDGMKFIGEMGNLRRLSLQDTGITVIGLSELSDHRNIEVLLISWNNISDEDLVFLEKMERLRFLGIKNTHVTEAGVALLKNKNKNLIIDY